jgi:hypothetical protein
VFPNNAGFVCHRGVDSRPQRPNELEVGRAGQATRQTTGPMHVTEQDRCLVRARLDKLSHPLVHLLVTASKKREQVGPHPHEEKEQPPDSGAVISVHLHAATVHAVGWKVLSFRGVDVHERHRPEGGHFLGLELVDQPEELFGQDIGGIAPAPLEIIEDKGSQVHEELGLAIGMDGPEPFLLHEGIDYMPADSEIRFFPGLDEGSKLGRDPCQSPLGVQDHYGPFESLYVLRPLLKA